ncbi:MAG: hypothetical protein M1840_008995 [Geoglossum simile]|nr:MAG: hypothetical protein M1840_008995 [Geoglossum simile]
MKSLRVVAISLAATLTSAVYTGNVVQYWIDHTSQFINGTIIGGLQTPQTAWTLAITSVSMYNAAVGSQDESLDFQQIAVSHAAHNALSSMNMFATGKPAMTYLAPPPPSINSESYESFLTQVKAIDVQKSAKLRAQLNYAMTNAAIAAWVTKFHYNAWRPETSIHHPDIWLASGQNVSDPNWHPLLTPTPIEQEYSSGHACVGGAPVAVLKAFEVATISIHFTNLSAASQEISDSRIYGGIHFTFATDIGRGIGDQVGRDTVDNFDELWDKF